MTSLPEERFVLKEENPNQWIEKGLYFFSWEKTRKKETGPIFCCYVLKLRMSSFLQNGACPHLFSADLEMLPEKTEKGACPLFSCFFPRKKI